LRMIWPYKPIGKSKQASRKGVRRTARRERRLRTALLAGILGWRHSEVDGLLPLARFSKNHNLELFFQDCRGFFDLTNIRPLAQVGLDMTQQVATDPSISGWTLETSVGF